MVRLLLLVLLAAAACGSNPTAATTPTSNRHAETPLSKEALVAFFQQRFPAEIQSGVLELDFGSGVEDDVLEELHIMGIDTVAQFAAIVPPDYEKRGLSTAPSSNVAGVTRDLMIIHDAKRYFTDAWRNSWSAGPDDFAAPQAYGLDLELLNSLHVFDGGGEGEGEYDGE